MHQDLEGGQNSKCYVKEVGKEQWDDYHLKSVQVGGNQELFNLLKDYKIQDYDFESKYGHPALEWFELRHLCKMDGYDFQVLPPPKNWTEIKER